MKALAETFSNAHCSLGLWHTSKTILAKQRSTFKRLETWEELNKSWNRLVADRTMEDYETQLGLMHATFPAA